MTASRPAWTSAYQNTQSILLLPLLGSLGSKCPCHALPTFQQTYPDRDSRTRSTWAAISGFEVGHWASTMPRCRSVLAASSNILLLDHDTIMPSRSRTPGLASGRPGPSGPGLFYFRLVSRYFAGPNTELASYKTVEQAAGKSLLSLACIHSHLEYVSNAEHALFGFLSVFSSSSASHLILVLLLALPSCGSCSRSLSSCRRSLTTAHGGPCRATTRPLSFL